MKKVFLVEAESCDYDQYDRIAVAADSSQEALEIAKELAYFEDDQGEVTAKEFDMTAESGVILDSFCAG